jgi:hypothetical protein
MRSVVLTLLLPSALSAQAYLIPPGSRVRLMKLSERYEPRRVGTVVSISADSAVLQFSTVPPTTGTFALTRLERWNGTRSRAPEAAALGAAAGAGIGFLAAAVISSTHCGDAMFCLDQRGVRTRLIPVGFVVGALIGRGRGAKRTVDRWAPLIR